MNARLLRLRQQQEIGIAGATPDAVRQAAANTMRLAWQTRHTNLFDWRLLYGGWSRAYGLKVADLAAPGEKTPPDLTPDDIRTLVAEMIRRYGTDDRAGPAEPPPGGRGPTVRNGQEMLFDAGGFDGDDPLAAFTVSRTTPDGTRWQRWRLFYAPGSETFDLTIGDQTRENLPVSTPGPVDRFTFRCGHNHTLFFVDGVPSTK